MIDTDLKHLESDLKEVINLFSGGDEFTIRHRFSHTDIKFVNTITINGKVYAYGNLVKLSNNELEYKRLVKRYAKLSLYKALVQFTGNSQPWGALTGIRPTKLAYDALEECGEFKEFFTDVMKVSQGKTALIERVINEQKGIYVKDEKLTDFFVFIPFCPSRCRYCSFISQDIKSAQKNINEYVEALIKEIEQSAHLIEKLGSIYIGGGTPVALDNDKLERILQTIDKINTGVEFTVEAGRPDRITEQTLQLLKKYRVTRICVNPQTFNDKTLKAIGRNHTSLDVEEKFALAKKHFATNMDLIAGLDDESFEDFKFSLDKAIELSPDNITVHTLCVKKGSYLAEEGKTLKKEEIEKMVDYAQIALEEAGYKPYYLYRQKYMAGNLENVGYAKAGKACVYNVHAMEEISNIVACGANAISKKIDFSLNRIERKASPKDVPTYICKLDTVIQEKKALFSKK